MYLFVQFENPVINSLIATQGFSMSYSISIFVSASAIDEEEVALTSVDGEMAFDVGETDDEPNTIGSWI